MGEEADNIVMSFRLTTKEAKQTETVKKQQTFPQETKSEPRPAHVDFCPKEREKILKKM